MSPLLRKLLAALVALPLPPVGVWLARGAGPAFLVVLGLFVAAQAVFWFLAAGPGVALWGGSILLGLLLTFASPSQPGGKPT